MNQEYSIKVCVNEPGSLPDSDIYPIDFRGTYSEIVYFIVSEYERHINDDEGDFCMAPQSMVIEIAEQVADICFSDTNSFRDDLPGGKYAIEVVNKDTDDEEDDLVVA